MLALLQVLAKSGFRFKSKWAAMLPGSSEGIYAFVAANYLSGALQKPALDPDSLLGVVELGGASLQVTNPKNAICLHVATVQRPSKLHVLLRTSYLCCKFTLN